LSQKAERMDFWGWIGGPALMCVGATLLFAAPIRVFGLQPPEPIFPMVPAFAWAVLRPSLTAPFVLLALGLFLDVTWGAPSGLWGLSLIAAYVVVLISRSIMSGQGRLTIGLWYGVVSAVAMGVAYAATTLESGVAPSLLATFWQYLPTLLLYPFAHGLIERFEDADVRFR
jgi:rod shape-determining protein MreD